MKGIVKSIMQSGLIWLLCFGFFNLQPTWAAGNIDNTYKYAWSENSGWQNFRPTDGGVTVYNTYLNGYAWAENIGWVKLGSGTGPYANTGNANWGVNHNSATGALSGYAWSENVGWINFNPTYSQVIIDTSTLKFEGYAWAENVGYIHFQNVSPEYYVKQEPGVPHVTTQAVTAIGTTSADGNGNITDLGAPNPTQHGVCWNTSGTPTVADSKTEEGSASATGAFTSGMTGLSPNTTYYVRAYVTDVVGTIYGNQVSFTTGGQGPTVTTQAVSAIAKTTATGNGNITDLGATNPTEHGVCWNTTGNPTIADSRTTDGAVATTGAFTSNITGLRSGTDYYVRAYATNAAGTSYGNQVFFISAGRLDTGKPSSYKVTVTKVKMFNGTSWVTLFSGTAQLDMVAGGTFPGISGLNLPAGTYSQIEITFNNAFPVTGTLSHDGRPYYTTATTFEGQTNLDSTPTTVAGDMGEFTFYEPAWGALNTDVTHTAAITPVTVGPATDYQPTLRFTISPTFHLKESAGDTPGFYFSLGVPTVSLVEP